MAALTVGLLACGSQEPRNELELAAQQLEDNIKHKRHNAVTHQLHTEFIAQQRFSKPEMRQQMLGLFMRYKNINVLVMNRDCQLDKAFYDRGRCVAQVALTGAQGVVPDRAQHYQVSTLWQLHNKQWQLVQLDWQ